MIASTRPDPLLARSWDFSHAHVFLAKQNGLQLANYQVIVLPSLEEKAGNHRGTEAQSEMLWFPLVPSVPLWLILFRR